MKAADKGEASADNFKLIQLDQPVKLPGLCIIDDLVTKPDRISFTNCYFHDGLDAGIVSKGGVDSLVANCVVERIAYTGIETSCGGEGAFAGRLSGFTFPLRMDACIVSMACENLAWQKLCSPRSTYRFTCGVWPLPASSDGTLRPCPLCIDRKCERASAMHCLQGMWWCGTTPFGTRGTGGRIKAPRESPASWGGPALP